MKKVLKKFGVIFISALLIGCIAIPSMATSIEDAKSEKSRLEKKKQEIQQKVNELEKEKGNIQSYITKLDKELNSLNASIDDLGGDIKKAEKDLKVTQKELKEAKQVEEDQYSTMKKRIKYMYENGSTEYIDVLLGSDSMGDLLNRSEYMAKISEYDNTMLTRYQETKKSVAKKQKKLEKNLEELNIMEEELKLEKESVSSLVSEKTKQLASYDGKIDDQSGLVDEYADKIKEQDNFIEKLIEEELRRAEERARKAEEERKRKEREEAEKNQNNNTNEQPDTPVSSSGFMWPASAGRTITSNFGHRSSPTAGASSYHEGIDIGVPSGSNIVAAADGTVAVATYQWAAGNYVMLTHGEGISTVYMHASKLLVSSGQSVKKGDVIALVGSTGVSTGPHLHFGVRVNGTYVNPLNYVG